MDIVRTLLAAGADPCVQNNEQRIALELSEEERVRQVFDQHLLESIAQSQLVFKSFGL